MVFLVLGKWKEACLGGYLFELPLYCRIILPENEGILRGEVADDSEFGLDIVVHLVVVTVKMVGSDI